MREIIQLEVVFRIDDGLVRWGSRFVFSGFRKRPTLFTMMMTHSKTRGFLHRAREGEEKVTLLRLERTMLSGNGLGQSEVDDVVRRWTMIPVVALAPAANGVADDAAACDRR
ncbi:hypothetical protein V8G54_027856 [Vigna mungo]|uniref:Uncharacterized protein n=1 Tax=Vigna mungo TaxID=3915 RepID=A0AAQ3MRB6_VIGMU